MVSLMRKTYRSIISLILAMVLVLTASISVSATEITNNDSTFNITVTDSEDIPVSSAEVYLYCFQNDEIICAGTTDEMGKCEFSYKYSNGEQEDEVQFADFLIYARKSGFCPQAYNLTKIYESGYENDAVYEIVLKTDSNYVLPEPTARSANSVPFTVTRGTEEVSPLTARAATPEEGYYNEWIPLGEFHANQHCEMSLTFTTSDKVKVDSAMSINNVFNLSGSRTRSFGSETTFPTFSPSSAKCIEYYTVGRFEIYSTYDVPTGYTLWYNVLDTLNGGSELGDTYNCSLCNDLYDDVFDSGCNVVPIASGTNAGSTISGFKSRSISIGGGIPLQTYGFNGTVGVTRITSTSTALTYVPTGSRDLLVYDLDGSREVWHVTYK